MVFAEEVEYGQFQRAPRRRIGIDLVLMRRHPCVKRFNTVDIPSERRVVPRCKGASCRESFSRNIWPRARFTATDGSISSYRFDPNRLRFCALSCSMPKRHFERYSEFPEPELIDAKVIR